MATEAQRIANKKNAQKSTGPKTEAGKAMSKLNALKHGRRAKTVVLVLPQEDPAELGDRIRQWIVDMRPGDAAERELVVRAAKTSFELDCLERREADGRARRLQEAQAKVDDETANRVCDLGRKLLPIADARTPADSRPPRDDHPEVFLRGLEGSAEGCRWLLDRWAELKQVLGRGKALTHADLYRLVRLQGKHPISAIYDPDLNRQFLAWEVLAPDFATGFWKRCHEMTPPCDPGFSGSMKWREIVEKPASKEAAIAVVGGVIDGRIARLKEMIALYEEVAREEEAERADAAWFDPSAEAEAVRRRRSTLTRELRQLIELILQMQAAREKRASREGEAPAGRRTAPDEPRRRGGRGEEKERPDGIRKTFTTGGTEGTEERGPAVMTDDDRVGRERTETKPARRAGARASLILPGAPERIVESGLADEVRALARTMSGGRPDVPISVTRGPDSETNEPASSRVRPAVPA
jgi:hypothetical protein